MPLKVQPQNIEKELLNKSIVYSFSLYVRMILKLLGGVFIAKFLGPSLYGLRNAFDLALSYEFYSDLGSFPALNRQVPYYRGEKDIEKAKTAISSVFGVNIIYAAIAAIILIAVSQYLRMKGYEQVYIDFSFFLGIMIFTGKLNRFLQVRLKVDKNFYLLSKIEILYGLIASVSGVVLVYFFGFRGLLTSLLSADLACICYMLIAGKKLPEIRISFQLYWHLIKIGFPIMIVFMLHLLLNSADRILILGMISDEALGYFGIATVAASIIGTIPNAVHGVTLAPIMEKFGRTNDKYRIKNYFIEPMILLAYMIPFLIACLFYGIHLPIEYFLTKYIQSIDVVKILIFSFYFNAVATPALSISLALNKQVRIIYLMIPLVALNFLLNFIIIKVGWGIEGVAFGTNISYFIYFCSILLFASNQFGETLKEYINLLSLIFSPFIYSLILLLGIEYFVSYEIHNLWSDIIRTSIKISLFSLLYSFIFFRIRRHSAFVKLIGNLHLIPKKVNAT